MKGVYSCYASAAFGLEGLVAGELRKLGLSEVKAENGGVRFNASAEELYLCNLKLHFCDRVFIIAAEQNCYSFENLFQLVFSVPWQEFADGSESFDISAKCARSRLMSPRDCQAITKKAIIEKLRKTLNKNVFPEKGASLPVLVSIRRAVPARLSHLERRSASSGDPCSGIGRTEPVEIGASLI